MATMKLLDKYWTEDALVLHIALDGEVTRNFGQGNKPTTIEYVVRVPKEDVQEVTSAQLRARIIAELQEQRNRVRGITDPRSGTPNFPDSLVIPDS